MIKRVRQVKLARNFGVHQTTISRKLKNLNTSYYKCKKNPGYKKTTSAQGKETLQRVGVAKKVEKFKKIQKLEKRKPS
jgi:arginine repressor